MKKIIILINILFLTGCFGEVGKGIITKQCHKNETINGIDISTNITIKSNQGNLDSLQIVETYKSENITSIINSKKSEANMYMNEPGINVNIEGNIITYNIDNQKTTNFVKERFNIKEETHKMLKYYEEQGYTCK